MKKFLVLLMTLCIALSCFSVVTFAEEAPADGDALIAEAPATKSTDNLIGAFYLQGESGYGYVPGGGEYQSDYEYSIAENIAKAVNGTNKVPFYAYDKDGSVFFDRFAQQSLIDEVNFAAAAGVDFIAYKYYAGYGIVNNDKTSLTFMNNQLKLHSTLAGQAVGFAKPVDFALVLDGDFNASKEADVIIDNYLIVKGYLTATDGRPVVFIDWNDDISNQITTINKKLKKIVADGANEKKKTTPKTLLNDDVEAMYVVALNAPSYDAAIAAGCDAVSWSQGAGKSGEAYTAMTARVEANWANGEKVIPNVVTGFDARALAENPIEITKKKYSNDKETSVRYSRKAEADDYVAEATPEELTAHLNNALATTNKPAELKAVMIYAWDDFTGGAYLCPTKTDKAYQYQYTYLAAIRAALFGGATTGFPTITMVDTAGNTIVTDETGVVTTTDKEGKVVSKVDKDGKDLLAENGGDNGKDNGNTNSGDKKGDSTLLIVIIAAAAVVIIAVVVVIIAATKKKKPEDKAE